MNSSDVIPRAGSANGDGSEEVPPTNGQDAVRRILATMRNADAVGVGALADMRRMDPTGRLSEVAVNRIIARHVPEHWLRAGELRKWALLIHCMALVAPDGLSNTKSLGEALFLAGFKETRFSNLLDATPTHLLRALPRAIRFLRSRGQPANPFDIAYMIMSQGTGKSDVIRQRIAQSYFRAEAKTHSFQSKPE